MYSKTKNSNFGHSNVGAQEVQPSTSNNTQYFHLQPFHIKKKRLADPYCTSLKSLLQETEPLTFISIKPNKWNQVSIANANQFQTC